MKFLVSMCCIITALAVVVTAIGRENEKRSTALRIVSGKKSDAIKEEVGKMQGRWKIVAAEDEGQDAREELKAVKVVITGNKIVFHNDVDAPEMIVTLRPDKRPKEIDLTLRAGGKAKSLIGIYSLKDGELRLCYNMVESQPRPATFSTKADNEAFEGFISRSLLVLNRVRDRR